MLEFLEITLRQQISKCNDQREQITLSVKVLRSLLRDGELLVQYRIGDIVLRLIRKQAFIMRTHIAELCNDLQILSELLFVNAVKILDRKSVV